MTGAELLDECRTRLRDTASPYFWTDRAIMRYLNKAEQLFAETTYVLIDYTSYTIATTTTDVTYAVEPEILQVLAVQEDASGNVLRRLNSNTHLIYTSDTGLPTYYYVPSAKPLTVGIYPKPDAVYTLNLIAAIKPSADFTEVGASAPAIPSEYHLDLVHYVVMTCLRQADTDAYDPNMASKAEQDWLTALRDAKRDVYRINFGSNTVANKPSWTGDRK